MPLEYAWNKRVMSMLLRGGSQISSISHDQWMKHSMRPSGGEYLEKVAAAGSWAAYEKQHRASLVRTFVSKFPQLPPDVIPIIVAFGFHTGDY